MRDAQALALGPIHNLLLVFSRGAEAGVPFLRAGELVKEGRLFVLDVFRELLLLGWMGRREDEGEAENSGEARPMAVCFCPWFRSSRRSTGLNRVRTQDASCFSPSTAPIRGSSFHPLV